MSKINPMQAAALNETAKPVENKPSTAKANPTTNKTAATAKPATKATTVKPAAVKPAITKPASKISVAPTIPKVSPKKVVKSEKLVKEKTPKLKMERDSFTMPKAEYAQLYVLKERLIKLGQPSKKSELLRAGIMQLTAMTDAALKAAMGKVPAIKTGRPKKK